MLTIRPTSFAASHSHEGKADAPITSVDTSGLNSGLPSKPSTLLLCRRLIFISYVHQLQLTKIRLFFAIGLFNPFPS